MNIWSPKYHISLKSKPLQVMNETASNHRMKPHFSVTPLSTLRAIVIHLLFLYRQKIIAKNEEIYEEQSGRSTCITIYEDDSETVEDSDNKR